MRKRVQAVLEKINNAVLNLETGHAGLMQGDAGLRLFNYQYSKFYDGAYGQETSTVLLENLAELSFKLEIPTLCSGKSGVNWFFTFLYNENELIAEDRELICDDEEDLAKSALVMVAENNYDYLHGAIGILYALLYSENRNKEVYIEQFFSILDNLIQKSPEKNIVPFFKFENNAFKADEVNLSLSHGVTGILKFCLECMKREVCLEKARKVAKSIADYLYTNHSDGTLGSFFANVIGGDSQFVPSRLAWCYGDLTIGYVLYQFGSWVDDTKVKTFGEEVLKGTTLRTNKINTMVSDAGICHGSAGIAHIYNRLYVTYQLASFRDARDYWITQTLDIIDHTDWSEGYKRYDGYKKSFEPDQTLLEGAAGIGLVLLTYLSGDFSWDYFLMLND